MNSVKCSNCGLTNWAAAPACKRCGAQLVCGEASFNSSPSPRASYQDAAGRQSAGYSSPPAAKDERMVPFGVLLIILGGIFAALHLGATLRGSHFPLYYLVLGLGILASGVVFCLKNWAAVYVYFVGFGLAVMTMFLTEGLVEKPLPRLAGPTLIGLFLLNKMAKAKKISTLQHAE
ncbi:MAG TPA: hypothetical protein VJT09_04855 [Pyrinomonadaceae bacterium]|nr:hypothetical protein [Pyrinomonadaceae bacterium]